MKIYQIGASILISLCACACKEEPKVEEKPKTTTIYQVPANMIEDKDGNLRFENNSLAPRSDSDKPVKVYPNNKSNDSVTVINLP